MVASLSSGARAYPRDETHHELLSYITRFQYFNPLVCEVVYQVGK
jgi:hypothetical protein